MKAQRALCLVLVLLLPLLLAACGGSQALQIQETALANPAIEAGADGDVPSIPLDHYVSGDNPGDPGDPGDPDDPGEPGDPGGDPVYRQVWGKDYLLEHNGTVVENSLELDPAGERLAWAIYRFSDLTDLQPLVLTVEAFPEEWGDQYYVGVANYTHMTWEFFGPADLIEYEILLGESDDRYVTHLGNFYFVVITHAGNVYEHVQSTLILSGYEEPVPPGTPYHLEASDGEFDGYVELTWEPGAGALGYEIWRSGEEENRPPGTDGDPTDPNDGWYPIGMSAFPEFADFDAIPGDLYLYKVCAYGEGGVSEFSNIDSGYAGGEPPPPPPDLAIAGHVRYGELHGVEGVTIYLIGPYGVQTTETNVDGHYYANELWPGVYIVAAYDPHHTFEPHYRIVELSADHPAGEASFVAYTEELPLHCLWGFTYGTGNWLEPDGTGDSGPLGGVTLTILHDELDMVWTSESNADGFWAHCELPGGGFTVHSGLEGYEFDPPVHDANINGEMVPPPLIFYGYYGYNPGGPQP